MDFYQLIEDGKKKCLRDSPTPCSHACPLGMDVRDFIKKFRSGLISAAYKTFSQSAVLPGVVCHICGEPCKNDCVRKEIDEEVSLKGLERFCWQQAHGQPKKAYYIREKKERILICGGEIGELVCAVKLARRGYPVDLAVKGNQLGGSLWDLDHEVLPPQVLEEDLNEILEEKYIHVLWRTSEIPSQMLPEYDAILLSEEDYGINSETLRDSKVFKIKQEGSPLENIHQGNQLSYQIEEYVKIHKVFMTQTSKSAEPYAPDPAGLEKKARTLPADEAHWTRDEAMTEAERCIQCQCSLCSDVCPMMQHYHEDYKQLASAVLDTVEAQEIDRKRGLYPLMSCLQCGACEQVCPVNIDTRRLCLSSRRMIHKKKILPQAHYHFWLEDMRHANDQAELLIPAAGSSRYVYFPGCQMGASYPEYVEHSYDWLRQLYGDQVALWNRCCCAPAYWCGNEVLYTEETQEIRSKWLEWGKPVFILSCPTCMEQFQAHFPEIEVVSLWSLLAGNMEQKEPRNQKFAIFDSCAARKDDQLLQDIRKIVSLAGYEGIELSKNKEQAQCCGYGGLVYSTNPQLVENVIAENSQQESCPFVTYCTNCMDSFRLSKKDARFIFDLAFEIQPQQQVPDLTGRRQNRMSLKYRLQKKYLHIERMEESMAYETISLRMDEETERSINKQLLLEDDIQQVIGYAEENSLYLYDGDTKEHIAHKQTGFITIWVRYKALGDDVYQISSVYFHRVKLKGEQNDGE